MKWSLVVATANRHKLRELRQIAELIAPGQLEFVSPQELGIPWEGIEESGTTVEENAYLKATALFERVWRPVVADDTGLEVEALGGNPGVNSARFVGSEAENRRAVLELLRGVPPERRRARFRTVLCYRDWLRTVCVEGVVEGWIAPEERGANGFGYDPIFIPEGCTQTFAEMEPEQKNRLSHRFRALRALWQYLQRLEEPEPEHAGTGLEIPSWLPWLMRICAAAARSGNAAELELLIARALREGMPVRALAEGLLQLSLFAGIPAAIEALSTAWAFCQRVGTPWEAPAEEASAADALEAYGGELFARIYGERATALRQRFRDIAPALETLIVRTAYGQILSRPGLGIVEREWAAIAALAVGGWWRQLAAHLRGALRLGVPIERCQELLEVLQPYCSADQWEELRRVWEYVRHGASLTAPHGNSDGNTGAV